MADNAFQRFGNRLLSPGNISDENVRRNRDMSRQLLRQVSTPQNIQHPTQGLALLANALNAQIFRQKANRGETALKEQKATQMGELLGNLNLGPEQRAIFDSLPKDAQQQIAIQASAQRLLPTGDKETSKQLREGDNFVTRRVVNGRVDQTDAGIISSSPIDRVQRTETGGPGAFSGKTPSQEGAAIEEFQNAAIGGLSAIQTGGELLQIAADTPEALGAPGTIVRAGNEFLRTAEALGGLMGVDVGADRGADDFTFEGFSGNLRNTAIESQAFRSGIYGIAFAAAVAEQGSRPTDKDIQAFIDQIAGSTADPLAFRRTIGTFVNRIDRRLRSTAAIKGIPEEISARAFGEIDSALTQFGQAGRSPVENLPGFEDMSAEEQRELIEAIKRNPNLLEGL